MSKNRKSRRRSKLVDKFGFESLEDRRMMATFVVSNLLDGPVSAGGDLPGSLRQAIFDANATAGADTIEFTGDATGGATITLSDGTLEVTESVDIVGPGAAELTIDANNASSIFSFGDEVGASTFDVSGLTLTGGDARNNNGIQSGGAVLFFDQFGSGGEDTLNISDSVIAGNDALLGGGLHAVMGSVNVTDTTFDNNRALRNVGSETCGGGLSLVHTDTTLTRVTVTGNTADDGGGGIANVADGGGSATGDANLTIIDSIITDNVADRGAGILNVTEVDAETADAILSVSGTTIQNNRATFFGGAVFAATRVW